MSIKTVYLAGGCFWGIQRFFDQIHAVKSTEVGYANGKTDQVTYKEVCSGNTGHVEAVKIEFDDEQLTLTELLEVFAQIIDPTSLNKQADDEGTQYRTGIYLPADEYEQSKAEVDQFLHDLSLYVDQPVVVENLPLDNYCSAEEYHQKYLDKNPDGYCHIHLDDYWHIISVANELTSMRLAPTSDEASDEQAITFKNDNNQQA